MRGKRYPDEFKIEAVKQVTECGHAVMDVATRLGVTIDITGSTSLLMKITNIPQ